MKIAFLNDQIHTYATQAGRSTWATGGAERQQWLLARALAASGWSVVVGIREPLPRGTRQTIDQVEFVGIGRDQIFAAWHRFFRAERPEWWFWQCASHLFGFGVGLAHLNGVKAVFGAGLDRDVRVREALYPRQRWWPVYAWGLWRAERIVLQHGGQLADLRARWRTKGHVVPNIAPRAERVMSHDERSPYVAWVAALRRVKRPDLLIEVAQLLPHVRFVVCGGPSLYMTPAGYSERMIETFQAIPNIDYRGQVSPDEAVRIATAAAVLLSTSDEEGFPQTFLEAWAHGTPVVSLSIDPDRVIARLGLGAVSADVRGAAEDIDRLVSRVDLREDMSRRAREYVSGAHSPTAASSAFARALGISTIESNRTRHVGDTSAFAPRSGP